VEWAFIALGAGAANARGERVDKAQWAARLREIVKTRRGR